jgi:ADP-ribose pyrophosphatase YjhB (NUDIX family)
MPTVNCLILRDSRLLMKRRTPGELQTPGLSLIEGSVNAGESPLAACVRLVEEDTGWRLMPSCVAVLLFGSDNESGEYCLSFIAQAAREQEVLAAHHLEWVQVSELGSREDVTKLDRELVPLLLSSHSPISVVVHLRDSPATAALGPISPIDPARLSPLVFAEVT